MSDEHCNGGNRHDPIGRIDEGRECASRQDDDESFDAVADKRQQRGRFVAGSQHVGCTRISGTVFVRIGQAKCLAHDNGKRHGSDQVRGDDDQAGSEHELIR